MKHSVLFVHGFGVMRDARGMFTDIVSSLPEEYECTLVDLNTKIGNTIFLSPFSKQVDILKGVRRSSAQETIDLVCHSQGCLVAALANLPNVRKAIFLAPALENNDKKMIEYFSRNPETKIDVEGTSTLARRDGTFTSVPSEYWKEIGSLDLNEVYNSFIKTHNTYVIKASQDEVVTKNNSKISFDPLQIMEIEADHDFTNNSREKLVTLVKSLLQ